LGGAAGNHRRSLLVTEEIGTHEAVSAELTEWIVEIFEAAGSEAVEGGNTRGVRRDGRPAETNGKLAYFFLGAL
jgi:hypothetical protein